MAAPSERIRAFLAVELSEPVRESLAELIRRLRPMPLRVSWVRPENLHLTLRFLGSVEQATLDEHVRLVSGEIAEVRAFAAAVRGVGAFPSMRKPSVIWTGLEDEGDTLARVQQAAETAAREIGLTPEKRGFVPHITLGRVKRDSPRVDITSYLAREASFDAGAFVVEAVSLFSSELTPQGARYTRLHRLALDGIRGTGSV